MENKKQLLILASSSPRRRTLLGIAGFMFSVITARVDETPLPDELPRDYTLRVSEAKARAVVDQVQGESLIVAADTTVADGDIIFGKPLHAQDAQNMLRYLQGRTHQVHTAVVILNPQTGQLVGEVATTDVPMRRYSDAEISAYIASGDPFDKAGGYAIQHPDFRPVAVRTGCYANVIGFPLCHFYRALQRLDFPVQQDIPLLCQNALEYQCGVFSNILRVQQS